MATARQRDAWGHTSNLMALIWNRHRAAKEKVVKPSAFNPFAVATPASKRMEKPVMVSIRDLRGLFFPGHRPAAPPQTPAQP
jgi:hypothetical protein